MSKKDSEGGGAFSQVLGPDYDYGAQILTPDELGMSSAGNFEALADDIGGLINYVKVLVTGRGRASRTGSPLGTKFFIKTPMACKDKATGKSVPRSIYINNVPDGSIPLLSSGGGGVQFRTFEGLIPGLMSNVAQINPLQILNAFTAGSSPTCQAIKMETIDSNNVRSTATAYVTNADINVMMNSWFNVSARPDTKEEDEEFTTMQSASSLINDKGTTIDYSKMPNDFFIKLYYSSLGLLGLYILLRLMLIKRLK
jgi:hypothetical protein